VESESFKNIYMCKEREQNKTLLENTSIFVLLISSIIYSI